MDYNPLVDYDQYCYLDYGYWYHPECGVSFLPGEITHDTGCPNPGAGYGECTWIFGPAHVLEAAAAAEASGDDDATINASARLSLAVLKKHFPQLIPRPFTPADQEAASKALDFYRFEINTGLRWEFDAYPGDTKPLKIRLKRHRYQLVELQIRLDEFEAFIAILEQLQDRPVVSRLPRFGRESITRMISSDETAAYRTTAEAIRAYLKTLKDNKDGSNKIWEAALSVAYTIHPDEWLAKDAAVPASSIPLLSLGTRWYLETILAKNGA